MGGLGRGEGCELERIKIEELRNVRSDLERRGLDEACCSQKKVEMRKRGHFVEANGFKLSASRSSKESDPYS